MFKRILTVLAVTIVMGLSLCLAGCGTQATGYQGKLEDGTSFVYIQLSDNAVMVSMVDDEHQGEDADAYSGKPTTDASGKTTVTDDETGKSVSFTLTENSDGTFDVDVEGHGKGTLKPYEGDILEVISAMADDDAEASK